MSGLRVAAHHHLNVSRSDMPEDHGGFLQLKHGPFVICTT